MKSEWACCPEDWKRGLSLHSFRGKKIKAVVLRVFWCSWRAAKNGKVVGVDMLSKANKWKSSLNVPSLSQFNVGASGGFYVVKIWPELPAMRAISSFLDWYLTGLAGSSGYSTAPAQALTQPESPQILGIMDINHTGQCRASFPAQGLKPWNNDVQRHIHRCPHLLPNLNLKPWFYKGFKETSIQRGKYRGRH